ncbi:DUF6634 family protein, partial [Thalassovita gelatinovora]|uniref:DUF6634 family protein n=1 Tax=Thalassovita gelatinovora TaxID=53501 RepID=UPI00349E50A3
MEFAMNNRDFWAQKIRTAITAADGGPSEHDLASAPALSYWRPHITHRGAPILWGMASGHPTLAEGWITTSQLVAIDVDRAWARTASRWYVLTQPFSGPVTVSCRPKCSFKPPSAQKRRGFSSPVLNG